MKISLQRLRIFSALLVALLILCSFSACTQASLTVAQKNAVLVEFQGYIINIQKANLKVNELDNGVFEYVDLKEDISLDKLIDNASSAQLTSEYRFSKKDEKFEIMGKGKVTKNMDTGAQTLNSADWINVDETKNQRILPSQVTNFGIPSMNYLSEIKCEEKDGMTQYTLILSKSSFDMQNEQMEKSRNSSSAQNSNSFYYKINKQQFIYTIDKDGVLIKYQTHNEAERVYYDADIESTQTEPEYQSSVTIKELVEHNSPDFKLTTE